MILALDNTTLTLLINPGARPPNDPATNAPLKFARERIEGLINSLSAADSLLIPTPVLAEVLVEAGEGGPALLEKVLTLARVRVAPFDARAAVETAAMEREARAFGSKKGASDQPWQKVKFDRQILAIARVGGADAIYTDDEKLSNFAKSVGIDARSTWELPVPDDGHSLLRLMIE